MYISLLIFRRIIIFVRNFFLWTEFIRLNNPWISRPLFHNHHIQILFQPSPINYQSVIEHRIIGKIIIWGILAAVSAHHALTKHRGLICCDNYESHVIKVHLLEKSQRLALLISLIGFQENFTFWGYEYRLKYFTLHKLQKLFQIWTC